MSMMDEIAAWTERVRTADGKVMTDERLREVFALVKNKANWKDPIDALVPMEKATEAEIVAAVQWFAGGIPEVTRERGNTWSVKGEGYYVWIGS